MNIIKKIPTILICMNDNNYLCQKNRNYDEENVLDTSGRRYDGRLQ